MRQAMHPTKLHFQVEENDYSYPNGGNFLRFASTDWYKSMWTVLDLQENGIYKLVQNGESRVMLKQL